MSLNLAASLDACPPDDEAEYGGPGKQSRAKTKAQTYRPYPHQLKFHESRSHRKAAIGGLGMGKTAMGCMEAVYVSCIYNASVPHVGIVGAPTYPMIRDVILPVFKEYWPRQLLRGGSWEKAWAKSEKVLYLDTGSAIFFRSMDRENFERTRGIEYVGWAWIDESALLKDDRAWIVVTGRIRYKRVPCRRAWTTTTPKGRNWVAQKWVLNPLDGYEYFHGRTRDNKALAPEYETNQRLEMSEREARQELDGEIVSLTGAVYDIRREEWPAGNLLVYDPDPGYPVYLVTDFGRLNPRAILVQPARALDVETGKAYDVDVVIGEWAEASGRPPYDHLIDDMATWALGCGFRISAVYGDPAGDSRNDQTYDTSARKLCKMLGGVPFLHPKGAERIKAKGEDLTAAWVRPAEGPPKLVWACGQIVDHLGAPIAHARNSLESFENLAYPQTRTGAPAPTESCKDGVTDHDTDAIRYYLVTRYAHRVWSARDFRNVGRAVAA